MDSNGYRPDPSKIAAIRELKPPTNTKEIRRILGMGNFYRKFVMNYSNIVRPITNLLKNNVKLVWSEECDQAFRTLKQKLTEAPILGLYSKGKPLILYTDASAFAVGAILAQETDEGEKVLQYASAMMDNHQMNYTCSEREMLSVIWCVDKFRHYLVLQKFKIVVDHCSLCYLMKLKNPSGRLSRWALKLQEYDFTIVYKSGKTHSNVDTLSRAPVNETVDKDVEEFPICQLDSINLAVEQQNDKFCSFINEMLNRNIKRFTQKFVKYEDIIYKKTFNNLGEEVNLVVLPKKLRKEILYAFHTDPMSAHQGLTRTLYRIKNEVLVESF